MFRYVAFNWAAAHAGQDALVRRFAAALSSSGWQRVYSSAGLSVYTVGCRRGVNAGYALPAHAGLVLGRLFRRSDLASTSTTDIELSDQEGDDIVRTDGRALIDRFWGRWIAFLPSKAGIGRVLRDPSGTLPCYRLEVEGVAMVFSWLEDLIDLLALPVPAVNWDAVGAVLVYGRLGARETGLQGVTQILAGELTPLTPSSSPPLALWGAINIARRPIDPEPGQAAKMLRDATTHCARAWMNCYDDIVLRLSGGVDSAILLGSFFVAMPTARITCLNYFSDGSDSDERSYARLAAERVNCPLIERRRDGNFHLSEVANPAITPSPANHIGRLGSDRIDAEVARSVGAPVLFTGAGGDQLFQEVRCTWPAADYLQQRGIDRGFLGAVLDAARLGHVSFWHCLAMAFRHRFSKRSSLTGAGRYLALLPRGAIDAALLQAHRFVHPGLLEGTDLPIGKLMQLRALICPFDYYNPFAPETSPELVHPLMSQPLLELSLQLPTYRLTEGGRPRGLARHAFSDRLPPEIATRQSKGGTEEHITDVLQRSQALAKTLLLDGQLVRHGLLDRARVEAALDRRPTTTDAYVSEVHSCIAIEAWLGCMARRRNRPHP